MIDLKSSTWGSAPTIDVAFAYEKKRVGADMQYRCKTTIKPVTGSNYFGYPIYLDLSIAGTKRKTVTLKTASPSQWSESITYTSAWYTVENKTTGTTSVDFRLYSGSGSTRNTTYTRSMGVDPAGSVISVSNGTLGTEMTISTTRYDDDFTHTLKYTCGSLSNVVIGEEKQDVETFEWTPPIELAEQNKTGKSVSIKFTLETYSGSTLVGSASTKTVTCTIPDVESMHPAVSLNVADTKVSAEQLATYGGKYVQGLSALEITLDETLAYGSAINTRSVVVDGVTYTSLPVVTPPLKNTGESEIVVKITDKRGFSAETRQTINVMPYFAPKITDIGVRRCDEDGTENDQGLYVEAWFSAEASNLDGISKNNITYLLEYKRTTDSAWTDTGLTGLQDQTSVTDASKKFKADVESAYDVRITVTDNHNSVSKETSASTAYATIDVHPTGTGVRFGGIAQEEDLFQCSMRALFDKDVAFVNPASVKEGLEAADKVHKHNAEDLIDGILPIERGGTGAATEDGARSNLNAIRIDLLWSNASSSSSFEGQTLDLGLQNYSAYIIVSRQNTSTTSSTSVMQRTGYNAKIGIPIYSSGLHIYMRSVDYSSGSLKFYSGYDNGSIDNSVAIPRFIYGVRGIQY